MPRATTVVVADRRALRPSTDLVSPATAFEADRRSSHLRFVGGLCFGSQW
jgi:hypothetical protein